MAARTVINLRFLLGLTAAIWAGFLFTEATGLPTRETRHVRNRRGLFDIAGSGFGLLNRMVWSEEANRLACEKYGFVDPEFKTGKTEVSDHNFVLGAGIKVFGSLAPSDILKKSCIDEGFYHPDKLVAEEAAKPTPAATATEEKATATGPAETEAQGDKTPEPEAAPERPASDEKPAASAQPVSVQDEAPKMTEEAAATPSEVASSVPVPGPDAAVIKELESKLEPVKSSNLAEGTGVEAHAEDKAAGVEPSTLTETKAEEEKPDEKPAASASSSGPRKIPVAIHHKKGKTGVGGSAVSFPPPGQKSQGFVEEGIARRQVD